LKGPGEVHKAGRHAGKAKKHHDGVVWRGDRGVIGVVIRGRRIRSLPNTGGVHGLCEVGEGRVGIEASGRG